MLWNWNTIGSCFIASSWHVTSSGMFAGSCIGVLLLVMLLEFLRRAVKEFDSYLIRKHEATLVASAAPASIDRAGSDNGDSAKAAASADVQLDSATQSAASAGFRPTILEQAIRAFLHTSQFAVAYFVML